MKKKIIFVSLIIFLLFIAIIFVNAESPNHQKKESAKYTQIPKNEQRGSDQFPMVVKVIPPTVADEKADADKQERKEKKESEWWLVKLTAALALIGAIQVIVFGLQARRLRQSVEATKEAAKAAKDSAEALPAIERAYIFVDMDGEVSRPTCKNIPGKGNFYFTAPINLINVGKTPAILKKIYVGIIKTKTIDKLTKTQAEEIIKEIPFDFDHMEDPDTDRREIRGGGSWSNHIRIDVSENDFWDADPHHLYCCGKVVYDDIMKNRQATWFCWEYKEGYGIYSGLFYRADNDELNDYT